MVESQFQGQQVVYVDNLRLSHTGVVVGESVDGQTVYVLSDRIEKIPASGWSFSIKADLMPGVLVDAQTA